jgi:hypothetical protein
MYGCMACCGYHYKALKKKDTLEGRYVLILCRDFLVSSLLLGMMCSFYMHDCIVL